MPERLTLGGDKMELPFQIKPQSRKVFQNSEFALLEPPKFPEEIKYIHTSLQSPVPVSEGVPCDAPTTGRARTTVTSKNCKDSSQFSNMAFLYGFGRKRDNSHCSIVLQHGKRPTKINNFRYSMLYNNVLIYRNKGCALTNPCHCISEDYGGFVER